MRLKYLFRDLKRKFKFAYQKMVYGFSDDETWSLDWTIAKFTLPRLKRFKKLSKCRPFGLTEEEWDKYLDDMIYFMEFYANDPWDDDASTDWIRIQRGQEYFGKYFNNLWW